eukprot:scaffold2849_cov174-Amphora_coffeaeformis.AAC.23
MILSLCGQRQRSHRAVEATPAIKIQNSPSPRYNQLLLPVHIFLTRRPLIKGKLPREDDYRKSQWWSAGDT